MTVLAAVAMAAQRLADAGIESARFDAEELAAHVLGIKRSALVLADWEADQQVEYGGLVHRRSTHVPLQHITGIAGFRHLDIPVGTGVFIPRPETETVTQAALDAIAGTTKPLCVDLCSGSGAIALSLAHEHPGAIVHAVELDATAHRWLVENSLLYSNVAPIETHLGDASRALPDLDGTVDLVVSNPPYVEADAELSPEVADHDPGLALWGGGDDGLDMVRVVVARARKLLRPGGTLVVEHSDRQGRSAARVARDAGFTDIHGRQDLTGRDRYFTARKPEPRGRLKVKLVWRRAP